MSKATLHVFLGKSNASNRIKMNRTQSQSAHETTDAMTAGKTGRAFLCLAKCMDGVPQNATLLAHQFPQILPCPPSGTQQPARVRRNGAPWLNAGHISTPLNGVRRARRHHVSDIQPGIRR